MCKHFVRWKGIFFLLVTTIPLTHFLCVLKVGGTCESLTVASQGSWPWLSFCGCCWVILLRSCVDRQTWVRQMPGSRQDQALRAAFSLSLFGSCLFQNWVTPDHSHKHRKQEEVGYSACPPSLMPHSDLTLHWSSECGRDHGSPERTRGRRLGGAWRPPRSLFPAERTSSAVLCPSHWGALKKVFALKCVG